jgi:stalled ribosome rescue protein Dom34
MDHREASVIELRDPGTTVVPVRSQMRPGRVHSREGHGRHEHMPDDHEFFDEIVSVAHAAEIIVAGPGTAKTAFVRYVREHHPDFAERVVRVDTVDHPGHSELVAHAREAFKGIDQMIGDPAAH